MAAPPWRSSSGGGSYTAVAARRTLGGPKSSNHIANVSQPLKWTLHENFPDKNGKGTMSAAPALSAASAPQARTTFPDKLKQYVARTFEDCTDAEKPQVEAELKRIITDAFNEKVVWTVDWDKMPLPQQVIANREMEVKKGAEGRSSKGDTSPTRRSFGAFSLGDKKRKSPEHTESLSPGNDKRPRSDYSYASPTDKLSQREKEKRARRFGLNNPPPPRPAPLEPVDTSKPLVGRCLTLEKKYFRLTSEADPNSVRPLHVLKQTLELLKRKWRTEQNYAYICDQFKSLRQDLTVQHIKNEFTVSAYEIHARIALEKGDLGEYNQCQSQLANLYAEGIKGHAFEFKGYRILYLIHTCNRADMNDLLASLTPAEKADEHIKHALDVRSAMSVNNYHRLFKLYLNAPSMGAYLMDAFVNRERLAALAAICKAYRPDIDTRFLAEELGFEGDHDCITWLVENGGEAFIKQTSNDKGVPNGIRFLTAKAGPTIEAAKSRAFHKVDIKGQI